MIWFLILAVAFGAFAFGFIIGIAYGVGEEQHRQMWRMLAEERRQRQENGHG